MRVQPAGVEAELNDPSGLWEALLPKAKLPLDYELEVEYPNGDTYTLRDPYAFLPTLGELDLHLVGEGRHEDLYERLGAHVRELDGVSRHRVRRVGAERALGRRRRRLQLAGTAACTRCARSARPGSGSSSSRTSAKARSTSSRSATQDGRLRIKADPVAFAAEVPPANASVVLPLDARMGATPSGSRARARVDPLRAPMSIYEVHLGSWRRNPLEGNRSLDYLELADELGRLRRRTSASRTSS